MALFKTGQELTAAERLSPQSIAKIVDDAIAKKRQEDAQRKRLHQNYGRQRSVSEMAGVRRNTNRMVGSE